MSINKVILIGNVGKDPEVRTLQNSKQVASFSLATSERWRDKVTGERKEKTEWHNIVVFSPGLIKIMPYIKKGRKLYIEGSLQTRKWTDQKTGVERWATDVVLKAFGSTIQILDKKEQSASPPPNSKLEDQHSSTSSEEDFDFDDDIPF